METGRSFSISYLNSTNQFVVFGGQISSLGLPNPDPYWKKVEGTDGNFYLMPFTSSTTINCDQISTKNLSDLVNYKIIDYSASDISGMETFYFPINVLASNSYNERYSTDFRKPTLSTKADAIALCSTVSTFGNNNTFISNTGVINEFSYSVDSGSGDSGSSFDDSNLVSAILMIPATIICLACMAVIFKMFINRRVRG